MTIPRRHIAAMAPYALADLTPPEGRRLISLSQNESLRPPSPRAVEAAARAMQDAALYPDPDWSRLRHALAEHHGLDARALLCGNGSLDLISCIARTFAGPDRAVLAPAHAYPFFRTVAAMSEARFDTASEDGTTVSVDGLLEAVRPDTGLLFLANPGNPTGTRLSVSELRRLRDTLRDDVLLVIDEAYGEFADHLKDGAMDMTRAPNTIILRTFSKAYGLAGARIGWGIFPPAVAREIRKVMNPNTLTSASEAAAVAALDDQAYMRETVDLTRQFRDAARRRLTAAGYRVAESFSNFLLIELPSPEAAARLDTRLRASGIFLRPQAGAGLPHCLRLTVGAEHDMEIALGTLEQEARS